MNGGGLDLTVEATLLRGVLPPGARLITGGGITIAYNGVSYPGRVIECREIRAGESGRCILGLTYYTKAPKIRVGDEVDLLAGATKCGSATVLGLA